ncbi:group-specific protein [Metabacillus fastidiosus]|nr:group-specific protein [Metabacillus fastidiosus]
MIAIQIDQKELTELYMNEIRKSIERLEQDMTFWDAKELKRQTNMSWNSIQEFFFHDPDFPKFKVNQKWYFPAAECRAFLIKWAEGYQVGFRNVSSL